MSNTNGLNADLNAGPDRGSDIGLIYEDEALLVVSKPQGMAVHPAPGSRTGTLVQRLREWYASRGFPNRHVAAVSRLDKGTSGLILLVTDPAAHPALHRQVVGRTIRREYICLVRGRPLFEETTVSVPLGRHWADPRRMAAYDLPPRQAEKWGARPAVSRLRVLQRFPEVALLSARLQTGRMHQIRAHCQFLRLPILGDPVYTGGLEAPSLPGAGQEILGTIWWQCLHAGRLQFRHPFSGDEIHLEVPPPAPFSTLLQFLGRDQDS